MTRNKGRSGNILKLSKEAVQEYLVSVYDQDVKVSSAWRLGGEKAASGELRGFSYGFPYVVEFTVGGKTKRAVLGTMRPEGFGHDLPSDRAQILLWQHSCFSKLPKHVRSIDVGAFDADGKGLKSLGNCGEFFILTEFVEGRPYHLDLERIMETARLEKLDERRSLALSKYLVDIHRVKHEAPWLYTRRLRDLVGHGECIMGLLDSYPPDLNLFPESYLIDVERDCIVWRWRLKRKAHRLSQVHGDYHPGNVLFRKDTDFTVLDRRRGEWGEPADDVAAMTINYLFYSLQKYGELKGVFLRLFMNFWTNYLLKANDQEILEVVQPFYAWRGLVVASPLWYPHLKKEIRLRLLNFVKNILQCDKFDPKDANFYITEA